jgi:hypothetical protein
MHTPEIVLLGGPNSGKTHYAGQLYGRLQRHSGQLQLRKGQGTPHDLSALAEVLHCLENGHAANHTSAGIWAEVLLPLIDKQGITMDLRWPDYGGEQLETVYKQREVPEAWRERLSKADGWLLLIRLRKETTYQDTLAELAERAKHSNGNDARAGTWDANARWVELLQILLHVAGLGTVERIHSPRLAILLSCYDELETNDELPSKVLAKRLPLVSSFINSLWTTDAVSVWGLSALGCLLEKNSANESFIDEGPESQGWIVAPEGGIQNPDLSRPLAWLLRKS